MVRKKGGSKSKFLKLGLGLITSMMVPLSLAAPIGLVDNGPNDNNSGVGIIEFDFGSANHEFSGTLTFGAGGGGTGVTDAANFITLTDFTMTNDFPQAIQQSGITFRLPTPIFYPAGSIVTSIVDGNWIDSPGSGDGLGSAVAARLNGSIDHGISGIADFSTSGGDASGAPFSVMQASNPTGHGGGYWDLNI